MVSAALNTSLTQGDRLRSLILSTPVSFDGRLPSERSLCDMLNISRAELRKVLADLEVEGKVYRHVGRGTFLLSAQSAHLINDPPTNLSRLAEQTSPREAMESRIALEPQLASLAAVHASPRQIQQAKSLSAAMRSVDDWTSYERLDSDFHTLIAQAAGNILLLELHRIVNAVRVSVVWSKLNIAQAGPTSAYHSFDEHDEIVAALERHDRAGAHDAMRRHLKSTLDAMLDD